MDSRSTDRTEDPAVAETPEDVAVLYSWANLHGAKYRDFSASRREYRAQLRHRAAEQVREQALLAQAEAEAAARTAESAARHAAEAARTNPTHMSDSGVQRSLRDAEEAARTAAAERVEAARRAEAAAVAEAAARREEREIAEAHASAQRQAARYADSEIRRKAIVGAQQPSPELPGQISDPYTIHSNPQTPVHSQPVLRTDADWDEQQQFTPTENSVSRDMGSRDMGPRDLGSTSDRERREYLPPAPLPAPVERRSSASHQTTSRRP